MVGGLIEQNLERDPHAAPAPAPVVATLAAPDADVAVTMHHQRRAAWRFATGTDPAAHIAIAADSDRLLALTAAPLRFGLPDVFDARGRAVLARCAVGTDPDPRDGSRIRGALPGSRPSSRWRERDYAPRW